MQGLSEFKYDKETGKFFSPFGKEIGSYTRKYGRHFYNGKEIKLHRLAFYLTNGQWPIEEVDHIDGDTHNNKWINLRECSREQNAKNRRRYVTNQSGYKGVYLKPYKDSMYIHASIQVNNKRIFLGVFESCELAARAYDEAAKQFHGKYAYLNFKD